MKNGEFERINNIPEGFMKIFYDMFGAQSPDVLTAQENEGEARLLWGPFQQADYPPHAQAEIRAKFISAESKAERLQMWENLAALEDFLASKEITDGVALFKLIREFLLRPENKDKFPFADWGFQIGKEKALGAHLLGVSSFLGDLLIKTDKKGRQVARFPKLMGGGDSKLALQNSVLMAEQTAPLHDVAKFLGSMKAQVAQDHMLIMAYLYRKYVGGESVAALIEDHENLQVEDEWIMKAESRDLLESQRAIFFIADTLTGAIKIEDEQMQLDYEQLVIRLKDLLERHVFQLKDGENLAKIFRPEWAVKTLQTYLVTLKAMAEELGQELDAGFFVPLFRVIYSALRTSQLAYAKYQRENQNGEYLRADWQRVDLAISDVLSLAKENGVERGLIEGDLLMPLEVLAAMIDEKPVVKVLAELELAELGLDTKVHDQALPILEKIAQESHDQYAEKIDKKGRDLAIQQASDAGIKHASELVSAILGQDVSAPKLVEKAGFKTLLAMIRPNVPNIAQVDLEKVKDLVVELAKDSWLSDSEKELIAEIMGRAGELSEDETQALLIASTGVHVSWAAIQDLRTTTEQAQDWEKLKAARQAGTSDLELMKKYPGLRIFRKAFRPFPAMQRAMFKEGLQGEAGSLEKATAMAVLEILKDLVKIGA